ncbi:MAG TPA: deoxyribodipyrimidine photo-lyase [Opitutales bacterium]|nr:deoxyribodipyrimidine photo-lyase [Opitutales bacterium]
MPAVLALLGDDLRVDDNRALSAAAATGCDVALLYVAEESALPTGAPLWWLGAALDDLSAQFEKHGAKLFAMKGSRHECVRGALRSLGAKTLFMNAGVDPARDSLFAEALRGEGHEVHVFSQSLHDENLLDREGRGYRVFSAFHKASLKLDMRKPCGVTPAFSSVRHIPGAIPALGFAAHLEKGWTTRLSRYWEPTAAGLEALLSLLPEKARWYHEERDIPFRDGTTRLSPYLRFGQIDAARLASILSELPESPGREALLRQLHWREFARHSLLHHPSMTGEPLDPAFAAMRWRSDEAGLEAWKEGRTGFPIVDAGMRQLWKTGWMHNRVRMICASFLVKDLLVDWRKGAAWFMETLVDADEASNALNWQWVAGSGPDAAPYFRVFNPRLQGEKFDPDGYYVRKFVPELAFLPGEWIHDPLRASDEVLAEAGLTPGTCPKPIVDHAAARLRALDAMRNARLEAGRGAAG